MIGTFNENPLLNTLLYECEFNDGTTKEYAANTIASNIFLESGADGFSSSLLYHIVDHKCSGEAIRMADKYITTKTGTKRMRQTTVGWKFLVEWANSSRQWIDLKNLERVKPRPGCRVCYSSEHRGGTCLCVVGALRSAKEGCHYFGCELSSSQDKP